MDTNQTINQVTQNKSYMAGNRLAEPLFLNNFPCITTKDIGTQRAAAGWVLMKTSWLYIVHRRPGNRIQGSVEH